MPQDLTLVQPGDLITADLINAIILKLQSLTATPATGTVVVPTLFGRSLDQARTIIALPGSRLTLSAVYDAAGLSVDPASQQNAARLVINQIPVPDAHVDPNTPVFLVVSAAVGGGGGTQNQPPSIDHFEPASVPAGANVTIVGANFGSLPSANRVQFGQGGPTVAASQGTPQALIVAVPATLPAGAVQVTVTNAVTGASPAKPLTVLPPLVTPLPTITSSVPPSPLSVLIGGVLQLNGTGFGTDVAGVTVGFAMTGNPPVNARPSSVSPTQLNVTVPDGIVGLTGSGQIADVGVTVTVGGQSSLPFTVKIRKP